MFETIKSWLWSSVRHALTTAGALALLLILKDATSVDFGNYNLFVAPALAAGIRFLSKYVPSTLSV